MTEPTPRSTLSSAMHRKIALLRLDTSTARASRADFRRYDGEGLERHQRLWAGVYEGLDDASFERLHQASLEKAIASTLALYSNQHRLLERSPATDAADSLGTALQKVRKTQTNPAAFDKKVAALLASATFSTIYQRLSTLLRSTKTTSLNYASLAWDLYQLQTSNKKATLQRWGRDYYRTSTPSNESTIQTSPKGAPE